MASLHIGYSPSPTVEILPPGLAAFQKAFPRVNVLLHDASRRELVDGLQDGTLELAIMPDAANSQTPGMEFEVLRTYPTSPLEAKRRESTRRGQLRQPTAPLSADCRRRGPLVRTFRKYHNLR